MKYRITLALAFVSLALAIGLGLFPDRGPAAALAAQGGYRANSPEYGISVFLYGNRRTLERDLALVRAVGFGWQKSLFRWRDLEGQCKGCYSWDESDRIVKASAEAGLKIIARIDWQPRWARADGAENGAPDNFQDFADFIAAFVERYQSGSPHGTVQAIEIWNEVNLQREWGDPISAQSAAEYVEMLGLAYTAAKAVDPSVTIVTAGLSPTGWNDDTARPDDDFLQWMYAAGLQGGVNYDVLGAHGNTQCPSVEADFGACPVQPERMPHASFYFRRIEQLREIMVANGDEAQQVWLLEFGWTTDPVNPSYSWFATTEERKATLFMEAFRYATANWTPWIGVMTVWTLSDPNWKPGTEQVYWAITNPDGTTRPAYERLLLASQQGELPGLTAGPPLPERTASNAAPAAGRGNNRSDARSASKPSGGGSSTAGSGPALGPPALPPLGGGGASLQVIDSGVNLRAGPTVDAQVLRLLEYGEALEALGDPRQVDGRSWLNVRTSDGQAGWVVADYVGPG